MQIDLDDDAGMTDYVTVPSGTYLCEIDDVRLGTTRAGDARWGIRLVVAEGEFVGRQAAWDGLVFSTRGRARVRRVLAALGLPSQGIVDIEPDQLRGRRALVEVRPSEFEHPSGAVIRRNEVPYDGYRPVQDATNNEDRPPKGAGDDPAETEIETMDIPF